MVVVSPAAKLNQKEKQQLMTSDPKPMSCPPGSLTAEELESEQEKVRNRLINNASDY